MTQKQALYNLYIFYEYLLQSYKKKTSFSPIFKISGYLQEASSKLVWSTILNFNHKKEKNWRSVIFSKDDFSCDVRGILMEALMWSSKVGLFCKDRQIELLLLKCMNKVVYHFMKSGKTKRFFYSFLIVKLLKVILLFFFRFL